MAVSSPWLRYGSWDELRLSGSVVPVEIEQTAEFSVLWFGKSRGFCYVVCQTGGNNCRLLTGEL